VDQRGFRAFYHALGAAVAAGGKSLHEPEDLGFMYSRAFEDPDGNGFGPVWFSPDAA
jgi:predicted lactoylglutathione lyase